MPGAGAAVVGVDGCAMTAGCGGCAGAGCARVSGGGVGVRGGGVDGGWVGVCASTVLDVMTLVEQTTAAMSAEMTALDLRFISTSISRAGGV